MKPERAVVCWAIWALVVIAIFIWLVMKASASHSSKRYPTQGSGAKLLIDPPKLKTASIALPTIKAIPIPAMRYYFAATAQADGLESDFSNEVVYTRTNYTPFVTRRSQMPNRTIRDIYTWLLCQWANTTPSVCTDAILDAYLARLTLDGQPLPTAPEQQAICLFCKSLRLIGIDDQFFALNIILNGTISRCLYPLINVIGPGDPWGIFMPDLYTLDANGIAGLGVDESRWIDTQFDPSVYGGIPVADPLNFGSSLMNSETSGWDWIGSPVNMIDLGLSDGVDYWHYLVCWNPQLSWTVGDGPAALSGILAGVSAATPEVNGWFSVNRDAVDNLVLRRGRTADGFSTLATDHTDNTGVFFAPDYGGIGFTCQNLAGTLGYNLSTRRFSFVAIHTALSAAEDEALYNAVNDLRLALGGGNV